MKNIISGQLGGFTLIELLVVVLIIGILSAVAVPQYQKAVAKSQAVQAITLLKTVGNAVESYIMANGQMPETFEELDIDLPSDYTGNETCSAYTKDVHSNGKWAISLEGTTVQDAYSAIWMCQLTGKYSGAGFGIQVSSPNNSSRPTKEILCAEYATFGFSEGDYCTKLFKSTTVAGRGAVTSFKLP